MTAWALALLAATAAAHGPAPAPLGVLGWTGGDGDCGLQGPVPSLVRTNVGLARRGADGRWAYGCPARWGDHEQALAASPDGSAVLLAGGTGAWWTDDGGCATRPVALPPGEVPLAVAAHDGAAWLLTRTFGGEAAATLWRVEDGEAEVAARPGFLPDGLVAGGGALWLAGARPAPTLLAVVDGVAGEPVSLGIEGVEQVIPRWAGDDELWAVTRAGPALTLRRLRPEPLQVAEGAVVLGPVATGAGRVAWVDGVRWSDAGGAWAPEGAAPGWTCLADHGGVPYTCGLDGVRRLDGPLVFTLEQLAGPDPACDAVDGACALDWLHFGGESGWIGTLPPACPGERRTAPTDEAPPDPACACGGPSGGGAGGLAVLLLALRRRVRGG